MVLRVSPGLWLDAEGASVADRNTRHWDEDFERPMSWNEAGVELFARLAEKAKAG